MDNDKAFLELEEEAVDPFAQYYKLGEPSRAEKVFAWQTAIGLQDVDKDRRYLELFLRNLLMGEQNELKNRYLHIEWEKHAKTAHSDTLSIETPDHEKLEKIKILSKETNVSAKTTANIIKLYHTFRNEKIYGRSDVMETLQLSDNASTTLLKKMYQLRFTEKMTGMEKGKYRFVV